MDYKRPVRIVACFDDPLANDCFESFPWNCTFPGYEIEYIHTLINGMLKLPVQWIRVESYTDIEQAMDNGTADTIGVSLSVAAQYTRRWGFLPAYEYDGISLISKVSYADSSQPFLLMSSFTWDLWLSIGLITLSLIFIRWASSKIERYRTVNGRFDFSPKGIMFYITFAFRTRIWYAVWFVLLSVILNFYSNLIAVTIVAPSTVKKASFASLADLGQKLVSKKCRLILSDRYKDNAEIHDSLVNPLRDDKHWQALYRQAFVENPPIYAENRETMANMILNSSCLVGVDWMTLDVFYSTNYCDMNIISYPDELPLFGYTFYNTRHDIQDAMATIITSNAFQTFNEYLTNKYFENKFPPLCLSKSKMTISDPTVPVSKVQDSFYMLGIGIALALVFVAMRYAKNLFDYVWKAKKNQSRSTSTQAIIRDRNLSGKRVQFTISTAQPKIEENLYNNNVVFINQRKSVASGFELNLL